MNELLERGFIDMERVYLVQHSYEYQYDDDLNIEETKIIGIYSSRDKAQQVVERYKTKKGFNRFPEDCFYIDAYELDKDHWKDGFITYDSSTDEWIE